MRRKGKHCLYFLTALSLALAQRARAAIFNDVLPGARPMGMGMAFTAVSDDINALFYNPAGLAGSDFTQMSGSLGRMESPLGPLSFIEMAYTRPFLPRPNSTVGASFLTLSQANGAGKKDEFLVHYSEPYRIPEIIPGLNFTRPVKFGGNFKLISVKGSKGYKFGPGLDAGLLFESDFGLRSGLSFTDLTPDMGVPNPSVNLGTAYLMDRWLDFVADVRIRRSLTQFFPGVEASFFQGLLKARMGKGLPLDGENGAAFGAGFNFSPVIVDFGMTVPWRGINRNAGAFQASVSYRFGAPPFYGRFVGTAAREAEDLKSVILNLEDRKRTLEAQATAAQATKDSAEGELRALQSRIGSLQEQARQLEYAVDAKKFEKAQPAQAPKPAPQPAAAAQPKPAAAAFPRRHTVAAGDTLRSIAAQQYGDPNLWELIYDANQDKIERGLPQEGAVLVIPAPNR